MGKYSIIKFPNIKKNQKRHEISKWGNVSHVQEENVLILLEERIQELEDNTNEFGRYKTAEKFEWWALCHRKYGVIQSYIKIVLTSAAHIQSFIRLI